MKIKFNENDDIEKLENELLERVNNNTTLGINNINGYIITYSFKLELDGNVYYINMELANGRYIGRIKELSKAYLYSYNSSLNDYLNMVIRAGFNYTIKTYDNINVIYVYNSKYSSLFESDM